MRFITRHRYCQLPLSYFYLLKLAGGHTYHSSIWFRKYISGPGFRNMKHSHHISDAILLQVHSSSILDPTPGDGIVCLESSISPPLKCADYPLFDFFLCWCQYIPVVCFLRPRLAVAYLFLQMFLDKNQ